MKGIIKKSDLVLAVLLLVFCAVTAWLAWQGGSYGARVVVTVDGTEKGWWPLDRDRVIDIDTGRGRNQLTIKDGKAFMSEADCPDGYCMHQHSASGGMDRTDQTIVCLPHKLVVMIEGPDGQVTEGGAEPVPDIVSGGPASGYMGQIPDDGSGSGSDMTENEREGDPYGD